MLTGWRKTVSKCFIIPQRVVLAIMGFLAVTLAYTIRTSLSLAITEMVIKRNKNNTAAECPVDEPIGPIGGISEPTEDHGEFDWDQELQGFILSSFYIGYVITHVPGGILASRFGGKPTLLIGMAVATFFTLITPVCVQAGGAPALIALRIIIGLGEGVVYPACNALLAAWTPISERGKMGTLVYSGGQIGSIVGTLISGVILGSEGGWVYVFYIFGGASVVWVIVFGFICYSNPDSHPFVTDKEKEFLQKELGQLKRDENQAPIPWKHIFSSPAMWALIAAQAGHNWGLFTMVTDLPKYMSDVLQFSIKENGVYSALPYACMWIVAQLTGFLSDFLISRNYIGITNARKLFTGIAAIGPGIFMIGASYAGCQRYLTVALFTIGMGFMGTFYSGLKVNNLDLAPNYAGVLMAITNGIGGITGIIAPYIIGVITPNSLLSEWRIVFWIAFVIFLVSTIIYTVWASGEMQPWNNPEKMMLIENGEIEPEEKNKNQSIHTNHSINGGTDNKKY